MNISSLTPLGPRVLVKRVPKANKIGSLYIPDQAQEKPEEAEVVAVGIGKNKEGREHEFTVKVGDKVMVSRWIGTDIFIGGEEHAVMFEKDLMGVCDLPEEPELEAVCHFDAGNSMVEQGELDDLYQRLVQDGVVSLLSCDGAPVYVVKLTYAAHRKLIMEDPSVRQSFRFLEAGRNRRNPYTKLGIHKVYGGWAHWIVPAAFNHAGTTPCPHE